VLGLAVIVAVAVVTTVIARNAPVQEEDAAAMIEVADVEREPPADEVSPRDESAPDPPAAADEDAVVATPVAEAEPPAAPPVADEEPGDAEVAAEDAEPGGTGPPSLHHEPISRGIRGNDLRFTVDVAPAGQYTSTVWYRAAPDGEWQRRNAEGGDEGTLTVVIPAGVWLSQDTTDVEYFIEVGVQGGGGGISRSGSAVKPYRFRLY